MAIRRLGVGKRLSEAVVHGDRVFLAGQVAEDASAPIRGQAQQILAQIDALLAEAGTNKSKLIFVQIWSLRASSMRGAWLVGPMNRPENR
nr:Rid family hydrolase [Parvibaculum sp.]